MGLEPMAFKFTVWHSTNWVIFTFLLVFFPIITQSSSNWKSIIIGSRTFCLQRSSFKRKIYFGHLGLKNLFYNFFLKKEDVLDSFNYFSAFWGLYNNHFQKKLTLSHIYSDGLHLNLYYNFVFKKGISYKNDILLVYLKNSGFKSKELKSMFSFSFYLKYKKFEVNLKNLSYLAFSHNKVIFQNFLEKFVLIFCKILNFYYYFIFNKCLVLNFGFFSLSCKKNDLLFFFPILKFINKEKIYEKKNTTILYKII